MWHNRLQLHKKILKYKPSKITVVDINENGLTELTRDLRSSNLLNYNNFGVYRSFGVESFIKPNIDKNLENSSIKIYNKLIKKIKKKEDIYKIYVNKAFLGDLIYDGDNIKELNKENIITIRPENIQISNQNEFDHNSYEGIIKSVIFSGTHTRYKILIDNIELECSLQSVGIKNLKENDKVYIHLPKNKIWGMND